MTIINFKGKATIDSYHLSVPYHYLTALPKKSVLAKGASPSFRENMVIHGDNLLALKALLPTHAGKVDCIYIDPPYNTGKHNEKWVYNDNVDHPMMQEWLDKVVDKEDLSRHDKWCCMMWPRLSLLCELLAEDGVIFISIDDNEQHRLRMMMDEIFGAENMIANFIWRGGKRNASKYISVSHEYMMLYAKNIGAVLASNPKWVEQKKGIDQIYKKEKILRKKHNVDFQKISAEMKEWFKRLPDDNPAKDHSQYRWCDEKGIYFAADISRGGGGGPKWPIKNPFTGEKVAIPQRGWSYSSLDSLKKDIQNGLVHFEGKNVPCKKLYLKDNEEQITETVFYKDRRGSSKRFRQLMGDDCFGFPKDEFVLSEKLAVFTKKDSIVLDSFAGSGTTAHAVLRLNKEDGGDRKFILVECEDYADKITAERVRRIIKGVPDAKDENLKRGLGGSFGYWELGDPVEMRPILEGNSLPSYEGLARYVFYTATGEQWSKKTMNKRIFLAGESKFYQVYMLYKPDREQLLATSLTLDVAESLPKPGKKWRLVFAPTRFASPDELARYKIKFCQLPFQIYKNIK